MAAYLQEWNIFESIPFPLGLSGVVIIFSNCLIIQDFFSWLLFSLNSSYALGAYCSKGKCTPAEWIFNANINYRKKINLIEKGNLIYLIGWRMERKILFNFVRKIFLLMISYKVYFLYVSSQILGQTIRGQTICLNHSWDVQFQLIVYRASVPGWISQV